MRRYRVRFPVSALVCPSFGRAFFVSTGTYPSAHTRFCADGRSASGPIPVSASVIPLGDDNYNFGDQVIPAHFVDPFMLLQWIYLVSISSRSYSKLQLEIQQFTHTPTPQILEFVARKLAHEVGRIGVLPLLLTGITPSAESHIPSPDSPALAWPTSGSTADRRFPHSHRYEGRSCPRWSD